MPGIIGIASLNNILYIDSFLGKATKSILHKDSYKIDSYIASNFAFARIHLGTFNPEKQPIFNEDKNIFIFMDGKIYDYEEEKQLLKQKGYKFIINNDPEFCLHLYEEEGEDFVKKLNGNFLIVIYNFKKRELLIFNDRYGLLPHYYTLSNEKLIFASEVKTILQDKTFKKEINDEAVANLFAFGEVIGDKTFFRNIKTLPPASVLKYKDGKVSIKQYWDFPYKPNYSKSEDAFVDNLITTFKNAVKIRTKEDFKYGVSLSGGLDSRLVVAATNKEQKGKVIAITFGPPDCSEVKIAQKVCREIGIKFKILPISPEIMIEGDEETIYLSEGLDYIGVSFIPPLFKIIRKNIDVIFDGFALDVTLGGSYLDRFPSRFKNKKELFDVSYKIRRFLFSDEEIRSLFKNRYYEKIKHFPLVSFKNTFGKIRESHFRNTIDHFILQHHMRRFALMGVVLGRYSVEYSHPTYDNDFIDVILAIPPELRASHIIYRKFLKKLFPELAKIPYDKTMLKPDLPISFWKMSIQYQHYLEALKKRIRRISKNKIFLPPKRSYVNFDEWFCKNKKWQAYFLKLLLSKDTISTKKYLNQDYIKRLFQEQFSGQRDNSMKILRIATFELFLKLFQ